jgi:hypothetical protein
LAFLITFIIKNLFSNFSLSDRCLALCDAGHPAIGGVDSLEKGKVQNYDGGDDEDLLESCAAQMQLSRELLLWTMFKCINPGFARVMQATQELKAMADKKDGEEEIRRNR